MKQFFLVKIRLSSYFWIFFVLFLFLSMVVPGNKFDSGALTLFSVNSFLYGFYIAPILGAQKARIEDLHRIIRSESNALFALMLKTKKLPAETRNHFQSLVVDYIRHKLHYKKPDSGEKQYEAIISFCINYKGKESDQMEKILEAIVSNQQNRTNFSMQVGNKVFANEWHVMMILFSITLGFILSIEIENIFLLHIIRALLCTGLTMLIVILLKLSTLTHKKANQMWTPLHKLLTSNFYRID